MSEPLDAKELAAEELNAEEMALWHAWKLATDTVRGRIAAELTSATGLSDADFGVLTRLAELGGGRMRQNALAESMGWHRSRLSHQLTRMEQRCLLTRHGAGGGVEVRLTDAGMETAGIARPAHAAAVRHYLIDPLTPAQRQRLHSTLDTLATQPSRDARHQAQRSDIGS